MLLNNPLDRSKAADLFERIQDYSAKLCGDCCVDILSDDGSYAGSVANGVGGISLDIEDTDPVESNSHGIVEHEEAANEIAEEDKRDSIGYVSFAFANSC
jgi:hypothetical protein